MLARQVKRHSGIQADKINVYSAYFALFFLMVESYFVDWQIRFSDQLSRPGDLNKDPMV